jgi:hypothetical protein
MDFPSNSKNPLGEQKEPKPAKVVEKVVSVDAVQRQKSIGRRFKAVFFGGEVKGASRYILTEVLLPALKNMIVDATSKGMERVVYGDAPRRRYDPGRPKISYNSPVDRLTRSPRGMLPDQPPLGGVPRRRQDIGEIILVSRDEADLVIERLNDIIDKYDVASVSDLHDLVGLPSTYVDNKWGWNSLNYANVRQTREGYLLDLPPVEPI